MTANHVEHEIATFPGSPGGAASSARGEAPFYQRMRRDPLQVRKATLASIVAKARPGIRFNEHIEGDGPTVFAHACKMGLEGICRSARTRCIALAARRIGSK